MTDCVQYHIHRAHSGICVSETNSAKNQREDLEEEEEEEEEEGEKVNGSEGRH